MKNAISVIAPNNFIDWNDDDDGGGGDGDYGDDDGDATTAAADDDDDSEEEEDCEDDDDDVDMIVTLFIAKNRIKKKAMATQMRCSKS